MCIGALGINLPHSKTPSLLFSRSTPLNLQTVQALLFRQFLLIYIGFSWTHLLKVTEFLVKISQFKFLVMKDKNIFVYELFCC